MTDRTRPGRVPGRGESHPGVIAGLAVILGITAAWWALALWPTQEAPGWLARTRSVCFGAAPGGLPDAAGWAALVGQPVVMLAIFLAGWGRELASGLRALSARSPGRVALASAAALVLVGVCAAGARVMAEPHLGGGADAAAGGGGSGSMTGLGTAGGLGSGTKFGSGRKFLSGTDAAIPSDPTLPPGTYPRLDRPAPPLDLPDQHGDRVTLASLRGRPVLVTFAYAHCETVCPVVVRDVLTSVRRLRDGGTRAGAVIVTLDPWRDTPSRLPHMAGTWGLGTDEHVLSGEVEEVERVLDAWNVPRSRDLSDGFIAHPRLVYLVGPDGRLAYAANGGPEELVALAKRL